MKKFIIYCIAFVIPVVCCFTLVEIIDSKIPNSYSYKYSFVKEHGKSIQALAIGHSQLYDGFKPESFFIPSFNLCNSAQSYVDDYYILKELLPYMPELRIVIMPYGYINVKERGMDKFIPNLRSVYYHKYMHIDYDGQLPLKYYFESSNDPKLAMSKAVHYFMKDVDIVGCDSMGRRNTHYLKDRKHELGYENIIGDYTQKSHENFCIGDEQYLIMTYQLLKDRGISLMLVSPPYYWDYYKHPNMEQKDFANKHMESLCRKYDIYYMNLEDDKSFLYDDYFNETHLSELGAEKLTNKLNQFIRPLFDSQQLKIAN